jgi:hypothetical protein
MKQLSEVPSEELKRARDIGAVAYLRSYILLMAREIGVEMEDTKTANSMTLDMVEPINHATEATWRALMEDTEGRDEAVERFRQSLERL